MTISTSTKETIVTSEPPIDPGRERGKLSRDVILRQAAAMFRRNGYRKTRLEDLADLLEVTRPAFYYHFKSKQEILVAIQTQAMNELAEQAEAITKESLTPCDMFWALLEAHARFVAANMDEAGIIFEEEGELPHDVQKTIVGMRKSYNQRLIDLYAAASAAGDLPPHEPHLAVYALLGSANWSYRWYSESRYGEPSEFAAGLVKVLRGQIQSGSSRPKRQRSSERKGS